MSRLISIAEASEMLGVTTKTLKIWTNEDKIKSYRTVGRHSRFRIEDIEGFLGEGIQTTKTNKDVFVYCRVSTKKQADSGNLQRQKERLTKYCNEKGYNILHIYEEVASGLNDNRRELAKYNGVDIEAVQKKEKLENNDELVNDLISVVNCFSARLYGARGGKKLKKVIAELETERGGSSEGNNKGSSH